MKQRGGDREETLPGGEETESDANWMAEALKEAALAVSHGDVPVGAVVVRDGAIIGRGHNRREADGDPLAHAEILALAAAARNTEGWRLDGCTLYVTLEPCAMCAGAVVNSRVERLVYAAADPKAGYCGSLGSLVEDSRLNHRPQVSRGLMAGPASDLLKSFFATLRRRGEAKADL